MREQPPSPGAGRDPDTPRCALPAPGDSQGQTRTTQPYSQSRVTDLDRELAVNARNAEWMLSELAFKLPVGQVTGQQRNEAADVLAELANKLRGSAPSIVIDGGGQ